MKKQIRKLFASMIAALIVSMSFASCGSVEEDSSMITENTTTTGGIVTTEENPIKVHPNIIYSTFCGSRMFLFSVSPLSRNL